MSFSVTGDRSFLDLPGDQHLFPSSPLKPLRESPLSHIQKTMSSPNNKSLLQMKIREHQIKNGEYNMQPTSQPLSESIFKNSAFGSARRRVVSTTTQLSLHNNNNSSQSASMQPKSVESKLFIQDLDNPYMKEAIGRLVNKELETRKLIINIFTILIYRLIKACWVLISKQNNWIIPRVIPIDYKGVQFILQSEKILCYSERVIYFVIFWNIFCSIYKLLKPIDKCLDLPLTEQQRKIIGLPSLEDKDFGEEDEEDRQEQEWIHKSRSSIVRETPVQIKIEDLDQSLSEFSTLNINPISISTNQLFSNKRI